MMETKEIQVFDFNLSQHNHVDVLYIHDRPSPKDLLDIDLKVLAKNVEIIAKPKSSGSVSEDNYHFQLYFDHNIVAAKNLDEIQIVNPNDWEILAKQHKNTSNDPLSGISIYFLHTGQGDFTFTSNPSTFTLSSLGATSVVGTRVGVVEVKWNDNEDYVEFSPGGDYRKSESKNIEIIHGGVQTTLPLSVGFSSSNLILNDGSTENSLTLRVVNISEVPITLNSNGGDTSQLVIYFDSSKNNEAWTLATPDQIEAIEMSVNPSDHWQIAKSDPDQPTTTWTILPQNGKTEIVSGEAFTVDISNIVTGYQVGRSNLHLRYENFPIYADGEFEAAIDKSPLLYTDGKVGIGTNEPQEKLHIEGELQIGGNNQSHATNMAKIKSRGAIAFCPNVEKLNPIDLLRVYDGDPNSQSTNRVATIKNDGKVGIGTNEPQEKLHIDEGSLRIDNGAIKSSGAIKFYPNVEQKTTTEDLLQVCDRNGDRVATISSNGNLGIGTDLPQQKLQVGGDIVLGNPQNNQRFRIHSRTIDQGDFLEIAHDKNDGNWAWKQGILFTRDGNVGIGKLPERNTKLDVNGSFKVAKGNTVTGIPVTQMKTVLLSESGTETVTFDSEVISAECAIKSFKIVKYGWWDKIIDINITCEIDSADPKKLNVKLEDKNSHFEKVTALVIAIVKEAV